MRFRKKFRWRSVSVSAPLEAQIDCPNAAAVDSAGRLSSAAIHSGRASPSQNSRKHEDFRKISERLREIRAASSRRGAARSQVAARAADNEPDEWTRGVETPGVLVKTPRKEPNPSPEPRPPRPMPQVQ